MLLRSVCCQQVKTIKYNKYALELWISTELTPENQFYKAKLNLF